MTYVLKGKRDGFNMYITIKTYTGSCIITDEFFNNYLHRIWVEYPLYHKRYYKNLVKEGV